MAMPQIVCKKLVEDFGLSERSFPGDIVVMRKDSNIGSQTMKAKNYLPVRNLTIYRLFCRQMFSCTLNLCYFMQNAMFKAN